MSQPASDARGPDEPAEFATAELRALFEDWLLQLEEEIVAFAKDRGLETVRAEEVANAFKISGESARFLLERIAKKRTDHATPTGGKEDADGRPQ